MLIAMVVVGEGSGLMFGICRCGRVCGKREWSLQMIEEWCHEDDLYRVRSMVTLCCAAAATGLTIQSVGLSGGISGGVRSIHASAYLYEVPTIVLVSRGCTGTTSRDPASSFGLNRLF